MSCVTLSNMCVQMSAVTLTDDDDGMPNATKAERAAGRASVTFLVMLLVAACSSPSDPYYAELERAGWTNDDSPLSQSELHALYEDMAREVCGEVRDALAAGASDDEVMERVLPLIDSENPTSTTAVGAFSATLDHRCDASQPDGLKAS